MKSNSRHIALSLLIMASALGSHTVRAEEGDWEKIKTFAHSQKQEAIAEGKKLIAETERNIEALKKDAKHSAAETKRAHEQNMAELEAKKKTAHAELIRLEAAAAGSWQAAREGVSDAYRDLHKAYEKASASARK